MKLTYRLLKDAPLMPKGHVLGFDEVLLENADGRNQTALKWLKAAEDIRETEVQETQSLIICKGEDFTYTYDKRTGLFTCLNYAGREYLNRPMEINLYRAPADNDRYIVTEWKRAHYHEAYSRAFETFLRQTKGTVTISSRMAVLAASVQRIMDVEAEWKIDCRGGIRCAMSVRRNTEFPVLPRFGVRLFLKKEFEDVSYYGMGPMESYCDKHRASSHGLYQAKVMEMHEDYIYPQENGSHYDCDYVELTDGRHSLAAASETPFSFNISPYTQEELERALHHYELKESDSTVLCLDYAQNGIGSNSCGPEVLPPYRLDEEEFVFEWKLVLSAGK